MMHWKLSFYDMDIVVIGGTRGCNWISFHLSHKNIIIARVGIDYD